MAADGGVRRAARTGSAWRTTDTAEKVWVWHVALDASAGSATYHLRVDQAEEQTEKVRTSGGHWRLTEMLMAVTQHRSQLQGT